MPGLAPFVPLAQVGPKIMALWFRHFFADLAATYPVLLAHCRAHRPDAVVYDATNWPARLAARRMGDVGPPPPTVQVASWFPHAVLRQARAFITHAGMNSTMEALYYGVPMLALPQMPEQVVNADRVAALDLGRKLDPQAITADALRSAVDQVVVSPVIQANLHRMQAEVRDAGGAEAGAQAIEEYLA
jgi:UDP:flavonoid glycosyltransferase YjiC (YdhE family)